MELGQKPGELDFLVTKSRFIASKQLSNTSFNYFSKKSQEILAQNRRNFELDKKYCRVSFKIRLS